MIEISKVVLDRVERFYHVEGIPQALAIQVALEVFADLQPRQRQLLVDVRVAGTDEDWRTTVCHVGHAIERSQAANDQRRQRYEKGSL